MKACGRPNRLRVLRQKWQGKRAGGAGGGGGGSAGSTGAGAAGGGGGGGAATSSGASLRVSTTESVTSAAAAVASALPAELLAVLCRANRKPPQGVITVLPARHTTHSTLSIVRTCGGGAAAFGVAAFH